MRMWHNCYQTENIYIIWIIKLSAEFCGKQVIYRPVNAEKNLHNNCTLITWHYFDTFSFPSVAFLLL